jgi:selenocysteine-specific translation elongation factor
MRYLILTIMVVACLGCREASPPKPVIVSVEKTTILPEENKMETTPESVRFRMPIDDAFALKIPGKVVVVGKIAEGEVRRGDRLKVKNGKDEIVVEVEGLEAFGAPVSIGRTGNNIGIMLVGVTKDQIGSGATLVR